ncbi:MAG: cadherin-like beta sandwich domain-containing protein [Eubacterium sp.]|nr:cadherin-like beta sandwich domain-containing protein [Eubacterium sp.]
MAKVYKKIAAISMAVMLLAGASATWAASAGITQQSNSNASAANDAGAAAQPVLSKDNSLKALSLSEGELSPAFKSSTVNYTATVGADTTSVEVDAQLSNSHATLDGISGNTDLQPGENKITVTVTSQAGTKAVYTITVTRSEAGAGTASDSENAGEAADGEAAGENAAGIDKAVINADGTVTVNGTTYQVSENYLSDSTTDGQVYSENTYEALQKQYKTLKKRSIMIFAAMVILICILIFLLVNIRMKHKLEEEEEIDLDEMFSNSSKNSPKSKRPKKSRVWEEDEEEDFLDDWPSEPLAVSGVLERNGRKKETGKTERKIYEVREPERSIRETGKAERNIRETRKAERKIHETREPDEKIWEEEHEYNEPAYKSGESTDSDVEIMDLNDL